MECQQGLVHVAHGKFMWFLCLAALWGSRGYRMNQPFIWEMDGVSLGIFLRTCFHPLLVVAVVASQRGYGALPRHPSLYHPSQKIPMTWQRLIRPAAGMPNVGREKWRWQHMDVSENRGTPKSSVLIGFSIINHPFWGTPILETPIWQLGITLRYLLSRGFPHLNLCGTCHNCLLGGVSHPPKNIIGIEDDGKDDVFFRKSWPPLIKSSMEFECPSHNSEAYILIYFNHLLTLSVRNGHLQLPDSTGHKKLSQLVDGSG